MKDFTLFIPFTLNVSVNGVNMTIVYIIDDLYGVDISLPSVQSVNGVNGVNKIIWISEDDWTWGALSHSVIGVNGVNSVNHNIWFVWCNVSLSVKGVNSKCCKME